MRHAVRMGEEMNLTHAPADQLAQARTAIVAFKTLGIPYNRIYTDFNSKVGKVRVKFYYAAKVPNSRVAGMVAMLGFAEQRHPRGPRSYVGYF